MGWDTSDPYYNPEKFNLEIVASDDSSDSYEFDMFVVWKHKETGQLFYATDSGCSCYSPFDNFTEEELHEAGNVHEIINAINDWAGSYYNPAELIEKVMALG